MADQRGITHKKPEGIAFAAMSSGTITLLLTTKLTVTQFIAKGVPDVSESVGEVTGRRIR